MMMSVSVLYRQVNSFFVAIWEKLRQQYERRCQQVALEAEAKRQRQFWRQLREARQEWELALRMQNEYTDSLLIDFGAYHIKASEMKFRHLNNMARQEGLRSMGDIFVDDSR